MLVPHRSGEVRGSIHRPDAAHRPPSLQAWSSLQAVRVCGRFRGCIWLSLGACGGCLVLASLRTLPKPLISCPRVLCQGADLITAGL